ncbi:hypothetical protein ACOXXX_08870 [Thalassococcus sp. BH17M4-6]|uniref:hypothetical protein n=1 Tax=Thalassococcus sp. BH17M4-6 TaxID=3413148 RepID=UPI003BC58E90
MFHGTFLSVISNGQARGATFQERVAPTDRNRHRYGAQAFKRAEKRPTDHLGQVFQQRVQHGQPLGLMMIVAAYLVHRFAVGLSGDLHL